MRTWHAIPDRSWTAIGQSVSGHGRAARLGYGLSYAVDASGGPFLNGRVSARVRLARKAPVEAAGLACRADRLRSLVAFYLRTSPTSPGRYDVMLATFKLGRLTSIVGMRDPIDLGSGEAHLALQFFSGEMIGQVAVGDDVHTLRATVAEPPFPGHAGVMRLHDSAVLVRGVHIEEIGTKPVLPEKPDDDRRPRPFAAFLCHSSADKEAVGRLVAMLRTAGIRYWIDEEQITFGDPIVAKIEDGLQNSRDVVVCLTKDLPKFGWCRGEYGPILHREFSGDTTRRVIPITLDGSAGADTVPLLLSDKMRADFTDDASTRAFLEFLRRDPSA